MVASMAAVAAIAAAVAVSLQRSASPAVTDAAIRTATDSIPATPDRATLPAPPPIPALKGDVPVAAANPTAPVSRPSERTPASNQLNAPFEKRATPTPPTPARDSAPSVAALSPAPAPAPPPAPVVRQLPESAAAPPARVVDDRADVTSAIMAYARALDQGDLTQALRLYPGMTPGQRQDLEAFWKAAGTMRTQWTVTDVVVEGDVATARVRGISVVTLARQPASEQRVNLRARLERRGGEWRLTALVN